MEHDARSTEHGVRSMEHGAWSAEHGAWSMNLNGMNDYIIFLNEITKKKQFVSL